MKPPTVTDDAVLRWGTFRAALVNGRGQRIDSKALSALRVALDQPEQPSQHSIRFDGFAWCLVCRHGDEEYRGTDEAGEPIPGEGCWVQSWWEANGTDLIDPDCEFPVTVHGDGWTNGVVLRPDCTPMRRPSVDLSSLNTLLDHLMRHDGPGAYPPSVADAIARLSNDYLLATHPTEEPTP